MSVAKAYAKALYEAACENRRSPDIAHSCDEIEKGLAEISALVGGSRDLKIILEGPIATVHEKAAILSELGKTLSFSDLLVRFVELLAFKGRLKHLADIESTFRMVRLEKEGGVSARLASAEPLGERDLQGLAQAFSKRLGKKVVFAVSHDPDLLAGVRVTVGGVTYDGTLRAQLEKLKNQFVLAAAGNSRLN